MTSQPSVAHCNQRGAPRTSMNVRMIRRHFTAARARTSTVIGALAPTAVGEWSGASYHEAIVTAVSTSHVTVIVRVDVPGRVVVVVTGHLMT